jgi:hypothetical protein
MSREVLVVLGTLGTADKHFMLKYNMGHSSCLRISSDIISLQNEGIGHY